MEKIFISLFIIILSGCFNPDNIYITNKTKSEVKFKMFFKKNSISDIRTILTIHYEDDYKDGERSRVKINYNLMAKSIILKPGETIKIGCGDITNSVPIPICSYRELQAEELEFVEYTHLEFKKNVRFNLKEFYRSRGSLDFETITITEDLFK